MFLNFLGVNFGDYFGKFKTIDIIFIGIALALLLVLIITLIVKKIRDNRVEKEMKEEFAKLRQENDVTNVVAATETKQEECACEETCECEVKQEECACEETCECEVKQEECACEETCECEAKQEECTCEETCECEVKQEECACEETCECEAKQEECTCEENSVACLTENEEVEAKEEVETTEEPKVEVNNRYSGKYEIFVENDYCRYRLKASNGEVLFVSDMYVNRDGALKSIAAVKRNLEKGHYSIISDKKKNYKFKFAAGNHRVLAVSANYSSEQSAARALESFKRFALTEEIVDVELEKEELDNALVLIEASREESKRGGKFVLKKDKNSVFTWEFKANNGEVLCRSGNLSTKAGLTNSIQSFKESVKSGKFYVQKDKNDHYAFMLYGSSGRLSFIGETYENENAVHMVVVSILNFVDLATIQDKTAPTPKKKPTNEKKVVTVTE